MTLSQKQIENLNKHNERQKVKREIRRHKICARCSNSFRDTSKRLSQRTCSLECSREWGVAKRKENGSYKRTQEQNNKKVASLAKLQAVGKCKISNEKKQKLSKLLKNRWATRKMHNNCKEANIEKYGVVHHMKTPEHRARNSKLHKGKIVSIETRKKLSLNAQKQTHRFSRCRGGYREDLGCYFRSSWEANYARLLTYLGIKWEYEAKTFDLDKGLTYTPDFKLSENHFVEIKGWMTQKSKEKLNKFKTLYPYVNLELIQRNKYRELCQQFENLVPNWEKIST